MFTRNKEQDISQILAELQDAHSWQWKINETTGRFLHRHNPRRVEEKHISEILELVSGEKKKSLLIFIEALYNSWNTYTHGTVERTVAPLLHKILRTHQFESYDYTGQIETYGVKWNLEKAARDTLQNFFDSMKEIPGSHGTSTLDGVKFESREENEEYVIYIESPLVYDYRLLMHIGGTTKQDDPNAAGGFGEGTAILALILLRDYEFTQIRFCSNDWEVFFLLDELPEHEYVKLVRGLYTGRKKRTIPFQGNFIEFRTKNPENIKAFLEAKKLFFSSENEDFKDATFNAEGVGGFKLLPGKKTVKSSFGYESEEDQSGNLYIAGQRRHFDKEEWNTVLHMHIWIWRNDVLPKDRDRGVVSSYDMRKIIDPIVDSIPPEQYVEMIKAMEYFWSEGKDFSSTIELLGRLLKKAEDHNITLDFPENYLADDFGYGDQDLKHLMEQKGYFFCRSMLKSVGMPSARKRFEEMGVHNRLKLTTEQEVRSKILHRVAAHEHIDKDNKEIYLFSREQENSIIEGQYHREYVWLSEEKMRMPFNEAVSTYLHELDHIYGADQSANFSYALTHTLSKLVHAFLKDAKFFQQLEKEWNESLEREGVKAESSIQEAEIPDENKPSEPEEEALS